MELWIGLVAGIIIGWVIEWIVDWVYWRRGVESFYATEQELRTELAGAHETIARLEQDLAKAQQSAAGSPAHSSSGDKQNATSSPARSQRAAKSGSK